MGFEYLVDIEKKKAIAMQGQWLNFVNFIIKGLQISNLISHQLVGNYIGFSFIISKMTPPLFLLLLFYNSVNGPFKF